MIDDRYYTLPEAAVYLGYSPRTVRRFIGKGLIKYSRPGFRYRFKKDWLDEFMACPSSGGASLSRADKILVKVNV